MLTLEPARMFGFSDRGLLREGLVADLNVFDPATVGPAMPELVFDLPGGARRLSQKAVGIKFTLVAGEVLIADGEASEARAGRLVRGPLATRASSSGNLSASSVGRRPEGRGVERRVHGLHRRQDLLGEEPQALLGLLGRHAAVEEVEDELLEADAPTAPCGCISITCSGRADGLGRSGARSTIPSADRDVGRSASSGTSSYALDAFEAGVVPLEVVVLRGAHLVVRSTASPPRPPLRSRRSTSTAAWSAGRAAGRARRGSR